MKRSLLFVLAAAAASLSAQEGQGWLLGHFGQSMFESKSNLKDTTHYGLSVGHWYTDHFGLDLRALRSDLELDSNPLAIQKDHQTHLLASGLFNFRPGAENWYPYFALGVGGTNVGSPYSGKAESTTKFNYHGGLGIMGRLAEHFLLDLNAKAVRVELPTARTEYLATLGLGFTWGGRKPVVAPPPPPPPAPEPEPAPAPAPVVVPPPPPPAPEPEPVKPAPLPVPPRIVLDEATLHFANGKADLGAEGIDAIRKVADSLKTYSGDYSLEVTGHTSSIGSKAFNKSLSKRRAEAVAKVLVDSGIPSVKVTTAGMGPDQPIADNKSKEGQAKNRRVEIDVKVRDGRADVREIKTDLVESTPKK
ncbi:OmpA family protein [Geothrix sp. 21YS21S-4]|uniref:OmpA family protein n=1 Tax=Geothrix sp. 21YS21S-4 TaxID=3068889 RepID=UPI0027BAE9F3|nr:OmpA family protein [Geothrix sp. 21YS21S-4]